MSYSGAETARESRELLGNALAALQDDSNIPEDVMAVVPNIAQAVGALFEAENASSEPDGKSCVKNALGTLSQTLALLQDVSGNHEDVKLATETLAETMSALYPLTTLPSRRPAANSVDTVEDSVPKAPKAMSALGVEIERPPAPEGMKEPQDIEANIGANTESNFYVGFSGEVSKGGVFLATYEVLPRGTPINMLVTLPGGFDFRTQGWVRFVRDPFDLNADSEPGMGIQFDGLSGDARELVMRFIRKRPPMFFDD